MSGLIKFLKSIIKWILLFLIIITLGIGGFFAYKFNNERLVTMFALECNFYEATMGKINALDKDLTVVDITEIEAEAGSKYYLIKKLNNSEIPDSLYRGIHLINDQTRIPKKGNIFKQEELTFATKDIYVFDRTDITSREINRKTLDMTHTEFIEKSELNHKARCNAISETTFYEKIEEKIQGTNQGNQI